MQLFLMRHGIAAEQDDPRYATDAERPLTPEGRDRTRWAARGLAALEVDPDLILTSPLRRAIETAEIVADELGLEPTRVIRETTVLEPSRAPNELFAVLSNLQVETVLCTGHLPHLDRTLAELLTGRPAPITTLKKAACAALVFDPRVSRGALIWLMEPRALRLLGGAEERD